MDSLVPPRLPGQPCPTCHSHRRLLLVLLGVVVIAATIILVWWHQEDRANFYEGYPTTMDGSVVLFTTGWQTEKGQYNGMLNVSLATNTVRPMGLPDVPGAFIAASLSPNHDDVAANFSEDGGAGSLMIEPVTTIASSTVVVESDATLPLYPGVWSLDNQTFAYAIPPVSASIADAKAYLYYRANKKTVAIGTGVPVGVSPEGSKAITFDGHYLYFSDASGSKEIPGIDLSASPVITVSTDGETLLVSDGGATNLYWLDWDTNTITRSGLIPVDAVAAIFSNAGDLLLVDQKDVAHAYRFTDTTFQEYARKQLMLPKGFTLLSWIS